MGGCDAICLECRLPARLAPLGGGNAGSLTVWTMDGAVQKTALSFKCRDPLCAVSRPLQALDYYALFQWHAVSPTQGRVFLIPAALELLCVIRVRALLRAARPHESVRIRALSPAARIASPPSLLPLLLPYFLSSSRRHDTLETTHGTPDLFCKLLHERTAARGYRGPALDAQHAREVHRQHIKRISLASALARPAHSLFACPCAPCAFVVADGNQKAHAWCVQADKREAPMATGTPGKGHLFPTKEAQDGLHRICAQAHGKSAGQPDKVADAMRALCGTSELKAASNDGKPGKATRKIDSLYALTCCHSIMLKAIPIRGGELAIYPFMLYILAGVKSRVLCGDTMCRCTQCKDALASLKDVVLPDEVEDFDWGNFNDVMVCVNAMHVWGVRSRRSRARV